ncbi:MAG: hypothetical protein NVS1B11_12800 [Terriglobales bacterium]
MSSGFPGFFANASCLAAKGTGLGGGAVFVTTARGAATCGGGAAARTPAFAPNTLLRSGTTGGAVTTAVLATALGGTRTAALETGCAFTIALLGTAITAPGTVWFTYFMFVTLLFATYVLLL